MKIFDVLLAQTLGLALTTTPALAQPPSANTPLGGPAIAGVCLLSQQDVLASAKVGIAANARLKQIAQSADAEISAARAPIESESKALQAQAASLKPADLQARRQALESRAQALQQLIEQRRREVELTRERALGQIARDTQPVLAAVYKARSCGLLFNRGAVLGGNLSGDLTSDVVRGLDARFTTINFDRATLPQQPASTGH